jgi:hypothetical protein
VIKRSKPKKLKETDIALIVVKYFSDKNHIVYKEVDSMYGIIDIVSIDPVTNFSTIVEVKTSFSLKVIEQAENGLRFANYTYVAIPLNRGGNVFAEKICKLLGIGVLYIKHGNIIVSTRPNFNSKPLKLKLKPFMQDNIAGSKNGIRMTDFKFTISQMVNVIKIKGDGISLDNCLHEVDFHWKTLNIAKQCVIKYCKKKIIKEFTVKDNKLFLESN